MSVGLDYAQLAVDADAVLQDVGFQLIHRKRTLGPYNVSTGLNPSSKSDVNRWAVQEESYVERNDDNRAETVIVLLLSALPAGNQPAENDQVIFGNQTYAIKKLDPISPANEVVLYRCQVRAVTVG